MCEFVSWIERRGKTYFLTGNKLFHTQKGRELLPTISPDDYCGHGTIRAYFGIDSQDGIDRECRDFSTPDNFPAGIVAAIRSGEMRGMGVAPSLLTEPALAEYEKVVKPAWTEYRKVTEAARTEYRKVTEPASAEYEKVMGGAFWDVFAVPANRIATWR